MYDLEDNLITIFDNYKECAIYFNTSVGSIKSHICRIKKGQIERKLDKQNHRWYKLFMIENQKVTIMNKTKIWLNDEIHIFRKHYLMCDKKEKNIFKKGLISYKNRFDNDKEFIYWYLKIIG